jgi:hypothetical protein
MLTPKQFENPGAPATCAIIATTPMIGWPKRALRLERLIADQSGRINRMEAPLEDVIVAVAQQGVGIVERWRLTTCRPEPPAGVCEAGCNHFFGTARRAAANLVRAGVEVTHHQLPFNGGAQRC